jgi:hypothetical protein
VTRRLRGWRSDALSWGLRRSTKPLPPKPDCRQPRCRPPPQGIGFLTASLVAVATVAGFQGQISKVRPRPGLKASLGPAPRRLPLRPRRGWAVASALPKPSPTQPIHSPAANPVPTHPSPPNPVHPGQVVRRARPRLACDRRPGGRPGYPDLLPADAPPRDPALHGPRGEGARVGGGGAAALGGQRRSGHRCLGGGSGSRRGQSARARALSPLHASAAPRSAPARPPLPTRLLPPKHPQDMAKAEADLVSVFNNSDEFQKLEKAPRDASAADPITWASFKSFLSQRKYAVWLFGTASTWFLLDSACLLGAGGGGGGGGVRSPRRGQGPRPARAPRRAESGHRRRGRAPRHPLPPPPIPPAPTAPSRVLRPEPVHPQGRRRHRLLRGRQGGLHGQGHLPLRVCQRLGHGDHHVRGARGWGWGEGGGLTAVVGRGPGLQR